MAGYSEYLKLDELLSLQQPRTRRRGSELLFIVVHQVYELWFKVMIDDLGSAMDSMDADDGRASLRYLRRLHAIERLMNEQMVLIDHLEPGAFADIRPALGAASAAQSQQFAAIEALSAPSPVRDHNVAPRDLWTSFCGFSRRAGLDMPSDERSDAHLRRGRSLVEMYSGRHEEQAELSEALLEHDLAFCLWRHRHSLAAARHIGTSPGTGGSAGVAYLEQRMSRRFYPELWAVRSLLVPVDAGHAVDSVDAGLSASNMTG